MMDVLCNYRSITMSAACRAPLLKAYLPASLPPRNRGHTCDAGNRCRPLLRLEKSAYYVLGLPVRCSLVHPCLHHRAICELYALLQPSHRTLPSPHLSSLLRCFHYLHCLIKDLLADVHFIFRTLLFSILIVSVPWLISMPRQL